MDIEAALLQSANDLIGFQIRDLGRHRRESNGDLEFFYDWSLRCKRIFGNFFLVLKQSLQVTGNRIMGHLTGFIDGTPIK
jgi:hypothetical protein